MPRTALSRLTSLIALPLTSLSALAQQRQQFTSADYAHAEKFMGYNTTPLVYKSAVRPTFLSASGPNASAAATSNDERFYYRNTIAEGTEFILVDPVAASQHPAFDHARLANAFTRSYDSIVAIRFLCGLGIGAALPSVIALATEYAPRARRSSAVQTRG